MAAWGIIMPAERDIHMVNLGSQAPRHVLRVTTDLSNNPARWEDRTPHLNRWAEGQHATELRRLHRQVPSPATDGGG